MPFLYNNEVKMVWGMLLKAMMMKLNFPVNFLFSNVEKLSRDEKMNIHNNFKILFLHNYEIFLFNKLEIINSFFPSNHFLKNVKMFFLNNFKTRILPRTHLLSMMVK